MSAPVSASRVALLVLEDGRIFRGEPFGAIGENLGEAVFTTGMTGYQETLTDPSYHRQIVVQTAPQIGNTGWNDEDDESARVQVAGYVVRDPARRPSSWRSRRALGEVLAEQGVVGVAGVDTRAVVRHLRERGAMRAGVFSGDALAPDGDLVERVLASPRMEGADLYGAVTTAEPYVVAAHGEARFRVAALDVGIKSNTPRMLAARGIEVHVLPADTSIEQIVDLGADGFFVSNGPGDPATADVPVALTRAVLERGIPTFGICFGNQILARALGRGTYKMRYGHRGINIPVVEHATGRVAITSQNHGFAVEGEAGERFDTPFGPAVITHTCPNDGCVEGLAGLDFPAFSVQYHPEAAAGPHDAADLFDRFVDLMAAHPAPRLHAVPGPGAPAPVSDGAAPVSDGAAPVSDDVAPVHDDAAPVSDSAAPVGDGVEPGPDQAALGTDAPAPEAGPAAGPGRGPAAEPVAAQSHEGTLVPPREPAADRVPDEIEPAVPPEPPLPPEPSLPPHPRPDGDPTIALPQTVHVAASIDETTVLPRVAPAATQHPHTGAAEDVADDPEETGEAGSEEQGGRHRLIEPHDGGEV